MSLPSNPYIYQALAIKHGLLLYARAGIAQEGLTRGSVSSVKGFFDRLRDWFKGYF